MLKIIFPTIILVPLTWISKPNIIGINTTTYSLLISGGSLKGCGAPRPTALLCPQRPLAEGQWSARPHVAISSAAGNGVLGPLSKVSGVTLVGGLGGAAVGFQGVSRTEGPRGDRSRLWGEARCRGFPGTARGSGVVQLPRATGPRHRCGAGLSPWQRELRGGAGRRDPHREGRGLGQGRGLWWRPCRGASRASRAEGARPRPGVEVSRSGGG